MSTKASAASLSVTVPNRSEAAAPIPAAKPRLMPRGRLIIMKIVAMKIARATTAL
ncbi:MAG: hypothetical protein ACUVUE_00310 [Candidatus Bathycorpusculaceae bacterium]